MTHYLGFSGLEAVTRYLGFSGLEAVTPKTCTNLLNHVSIS